MSKRIKWTYEAKLDYILEGEHGKWAIEFLNEEGNPYECPITTDPKLVEKLEKLEELGLAGRLRVAVEINKKLDEKNRQYPILIICLFNNSSHLSPMYQKRSNYSMQMPFVV